MPEWDIPGIGKRELRKYSRRSSQAGYNKTNLTGFLYFAVTYEESPVCVNYVLHVHKPTVNQPGMDPPLSVK